MTQLTIHGHRTNMVMRLSDSGNWTTVDPIVFRLDTTVFRKRLVVPAGSAVTKPKPKRVRARLIKDFLLEQRRAKALPITRVGIDNVFLEALTLDGVPNWRRRVDRVWLSIKGFAVRPIHYFM